MGEDPLALLDLFNSVSIQPCGEQFLALAAAPAGVVGGLDSVDLSLGPAALQQDALEAVITHAGNRRVVAGDDQDLIAGLHASSDEALCGLSADAVVVALDGSDGVGGDGINNTVEHNEGDTAVCQLLHGSFDGVVLRQDNDVLGSLVFDQVFDLGNLVCCIGGGDDLDSVLTGIIDLLCVLFGIGHNGTGPAVVGVGNQNCDVSCVALGTAATGDEGQGHSQDKNER